MWFVYIYRVLYLIVHSIYTVFEYVYCVLDIINNAVVTIYHEVFPATQSNKQIQNKLHKIIKTPVHLTVLLGHEEPYLENLANLIIWCLATQISFISFYDYKGSLKKSEDELRYEVNQRKSKEDHIIWHSSIHSSYTNGFIGKKIHVKIIIQEEGKHSVTDLTKAISLRKNQKFNIESVSDDLRKKFEFPDPDLGIVCGETFSFYNYPPWQIRVTEFFRIKSIHNITFSSFVEELLKYSKCEQRLGK